MIHGIKEFSDVELERENISRVIAACLSAKCFQPINGTPEEFVAALIDELKPHVPYDRSRPATVYFDGKVWPIPGMRQEKQVA